MAQPPQSSDAAPKTLGKNDLTYNAYLKVPDLLALQQPLSKPAHHDEMLFIVIHQTYELWFKLVLHEMENSIRYMNEGKVLRAHHFVKRVVEILRLLVPQIHILETMTPLEFLEFRDSLGPASGFQSIQYREIEFLAGMKNENYFKSFQNQPEYLARLKQRMAEPDLRHSFFTTLGKQGFDVGTAAQAVDPMSEADHEKVMVALTKIYSEPDNMLPIYLLCEALVEFDEYLSLWREHHVRVVERIIGFKMGTGGSAGVNYLRSQTVKKCFPQLWEVRSRLSKQPGHY
ncbi:MAG: tryptophan 2,3-dioxygenase [Bacteriovoracia bacterium]